MSGGLPGLAPPKPIPIKDRSSLLFIEKGRLDVLDGAFVVVDERGVRTQIPVGGLVCLMLEPGTRVSHAAVGLAARAGTLLVWVGEAGVRLYAAGQPGGARSDRLLWQARLALDEGARLKVVRRMFELRFDEPAPERRSVDQLRGIEGARVRRSYELYARQNGVTWRRRAYDRGDWDAADTPNRCLSAATACLHGITRGIVLGLGVELDLHPREEQLTLFDLYAADEVFVTGTVCELVPVVAVDDRVIGAGEPGPTYRRLLSAYRDLVRRAAE